MVTVDEAIIARSSAGGMHFEILVDPDIAYDLREGKTVSLSRLLAVNAVFSDAKKGTRSSPGDLEKAFHTTDVEKIAGLIVTKGDIQLTTEFRRRKVEEKKKQIATFIAKNAVNPQTGIPHPPDRILAAMEQARINIDPFKPADQQVDDVIAAIRSIIPISVEAATLVIEVPARSAGRAYGFLKELGLQKEQWLSDGTLVATVTVPAGMRENVFRRVGALTDGAAKIEEKT